MLLPEMATAKQHLVMFDAWFAPVALLERVGGGACSPDLPFCEGQHEPVYYGRIMHDKCVSVEKKAEKLFLVAHDIRILS